MQRIKNIEFLRVFLIITIVLFHMRTSLVKLHTDFFQNMFDSMATARNGVEAFFIISGFFLLITFKNINLSDFVKKKFLRLAPAATFSIILCAIGSLFKATHFKPINDIMAGFLLCNFGRYWCKSSNVVLWYTSALFFGLIIYYIILKYVNKKYQLTLFIVLGLGSYALLSLFCNGLYGGHTVVYHGLISVSTLRAFGGIGLGCLIGFLYQKYKDKIEDLEINIIQKAVLIGTEILSFLFIIWWSYFKHPDIDNGIYVFVFVILFLCFLLKNGLLSKIVDNDFWNIIGKYSYSLFVVHAPVIKIVNKTIIIPNSEIAVNHCYATILICMFFAITVSIITYYTVERPCYNIIKKQENKCVFKKN